MLAKEIEYFLSQITLQSVSLMLRTHPLNKCRLQKIFFVAVFISFAILPIFCITKKHCCRLLRIKVSDKAWQVGRNMRNVKVIQEPEVMESNTVSKTPYEDRITNQSKSTLVLLKCFYFVPTLLF